MVVSCGVVAYLHECYIGPFVAAAYLVELEEVWHRPLKELRVQLVPDIVDHDHRRRPDQRLLLWVGAENRPAQKKKRWKKNT